VAQSVDAPRPHSSVWLGSHARRIQDQAARPLSYGINETCVPSGEHTGLSRRWEHPDEVSARASRHGSRVEGDERDQRAALRARRAPPPPPPHIAPGPRRERVAQTQTRALTTQRGTRTVPCCRGRARCQPTQQLAPARPCPRCSDPRTMAARCWCCCA
jgi:hypothetical protein